MASLPGVCNHSFFLVFDPAMRYAVAMGWLVATAWALGVAELAAWAAGPPPPPPAVPVSPPREVRQPSPKPADIALAEDETPAPEQGQVGEETEIPPPPGPGDGPGAAAGSEADGTAADQDESGPEPGNGEAPSAAPSKADYPYERIITARNAFGLRPIPPPAPIPEPTNQINVQPSALKLTGVITLLGAKHALFVLQEPGKPQLNSELVKEGEKDGNITNLEVLHIDERGTNPSVKVVYGGKELTLNFVDNGLKPPVAPAAAPAAAGTPGRTAPAIAGVPPPTVRQPAARTTVTPIGTPGTIPSVTGSSGLRNIPVRPTRLGGTSASIRSSGGTPGVYQVGSSGSPAEAVVPPDQQALMMRAQEEIARRQGMSFPPSPPGIGQMPGLPGAPTE